MIKNRITLKIVVTFVFLAFFLLNYYTPRTMDDFNYSYKFTEYGKGNDKISSLSEIPLSQFHHYFTINGRSLVHSFAQFFSFQKSDFLFNILNSFALIILITLIALYARMKTGYGNLTKLWLTSFILFWFLVPDPATTLMWKTGSLNYLWPSVLIMLFLCIHHKISTVKFSEKWLMPILLVAGIICGWGHEGISIGVSLGLFVYHVYNRKTITPSIFFLVIGFWIGTSLVVFAPSILARADGSLLNSNLFTFILKRLMAVFRMFFEMQTKATLIVTIGISILFFNKRLFLKKFISDHLFLFLSFFFYLMFQLLTAFPGQGRGAIGMELIAILLILLYLIDIRSKIPTRIQKVIVPLLFILYVVDYGSSLNSCIKNSNSVQKLVSDYTNSTNGIVRSPFPDKFLNDRFIFYEYSSDPTFAQNVAFSKFYGRDKPLIVLGRELYDEIYLGGDFFKNENRISRNCNFYTNCELDCFVARQDSADIDQKKRNVIRKYAVEPFSNEILNKFLGPFKARIANHYSGEVEANILNTDKGSFLLVPKLELVKGIRIKEINTIE